MFRIFKKYSDGVQINLNQYEGLEMMYHNGKFITAYFPSERKAQFMRPNGVENITLENTYGIDESAGDILLKYMVHLKLSKHMQETKVIKRQQIKFRNGLIDLIQHCRFY